MSMQKCDKQLHIYNTAVYDSCPMCQPETDINTKNNTAIDTGNHTRQIEDEGNTFAFTQKLSGTNNNQEHTTIISFGDDEEVSSDNLPVVGWLIVIDGPGKGKDFRLVQGENNVGRGSDNEVCMNLGIETDKSISREAHVTVVYDNKANEFFIERGSSRNLPMVNGKTIRRSQDLFHGDIIEVGQTKLMFVQLCGENFKW